jgi:hypothetical protein
MLLVAGDGVKNASEYSAFDAKKRADVVAAQGNFMLGEFEMLLLLVGYKVKNCGCEFYVSILDQSY